jgi:hypothetical protein
MASDGSTMIGMMGITITTDLASGKAIELARQAAVELAFALEPVTDTEFVAQKGSLGRSLLLGPFVAYCRFRISVIEFEDDEVDLILQRNFPWWAGFTGVARSRAWLLRLAKAIQTRIEQSGGQVLESKEAW